MKKILILFSLICLCVCLYGCENSRPEPIRINVTANHTTTADSTHSESAVTPGKTTPNTENKPTTSVAATSAPSYTKAQIVGMLCDAVNKTKSYSGQLTVRHTECFSAQTTEITGGSLVSGFADKLISSVVKPTDETLTFSNCQATDSEGGNIGLLLPKSNSCTLAPEYVQDTSVSTVNGKTVISVTLISESVGMYDIPQGNNSCIGYLNTADFDISILTVEKADITYSGSVIKAQINSDGYIDSITYSVPMHIEGSASAFGIRGSAVFDGQQEENWIISW